MTDQPMTQQDMALTVDETFDAMNELFMAVMQGGNLIAAQGMLDLMAQQVGAMHAALQATIQERDQAIEAVAFMEVEIEQVKAIVSGRYIPRDEITSELAKLVRSFASETFESGCEAASESVMNDLANALQSMFDDLPYGDAQEAASYLLAMDAWWFDDDEHEMSDAAKAKFRELIDQLIQEELP
jgi:hypothetical protein